MQSSQHTPIKLFLDITGTTVLIKTLCFETLYCFSQIYLLNQKEKPSSEMNYLFTDSLNNAPVGSKVVIT